MHVQRHDRAGLKHLILFFFDRIYELFQPLAVGVQLVQSIISAENLLNTGIAVVKVNFLLQQCFRCSSLINEYDYDDDWVRLNKIQRQTDGKTTSHSKN